jgi:molecular chaperone DnaK (HSP70)
MADSLNTIFGIDLGTTYSCIAYVDEHGKPVVVPNAENERITPSVVFFDGPNVVVGNVAKESAKLYPQAVVEMVKRDMGNPQYLFEKDGKTYRPEEISSFVLRKLVRDAEQNLGRTIRDVIITCPAYFGVNQREATAKAGEVAGLNVRCIINEPTAAAISYGMDKAQDQVVLVYDLGGGTFDITMIEVKGGCITVICTGGDHNLGGKDWDKAVVNYLVSQYQEETSSAEDILASPETVQELYLTAERSKKTLSARDRAPVVVTGTQRAKVELTRAKFDEVTADLLDRTVTLTQQMLAEARQKGYARYDKILLVGGSTRMPQVAERLKKEFSVPIELHDPDESVAKGAAIYGWKLALDDQIKIEIANTTGQQPENVNPGAVAPAVVERAVEAVADKFDLRLAAVQKAARTKVSNVTSKTFGVVVRIRERGVDKDMVSNLIRRNDPVPAEKTRQYGTLEANQASVDIRLMEGLGLSDLDEVAQCTEIGTGELPLPPGLPAGAPLSVTFRLNEQGRLEVTALDLTGKKQIQFEVQTAGVMSDEEVQQAKERALAMPVS